MENWRNYLIEDKEEPSLLQSEEGKDALKRLMFGVNSLHHVVTPSSNQFNPPSHSARTRPKYAKAIDIGPAHVKPGYQGARIFIYLEMKQGLAQLREGTIKDYNKWLRGGNVAVYGKKVEAFQAMAESFFKRLGVSGEMKPWATGAKAAERDKREFRIILQVYYKL